jgi:hypothetical protein
MSPYESIPDCLRTPNNAVQLDFYPQLSLSSPITIHGCILVDNNVYK